MPKSTAGVSVNRFCRRDGRHIAMAATASDRTAPMCIVAGGGSISGSRRRHAEESIDRIVKAAPTSPAMIDTAISRERYNLAAIPRCIRLESQRRMAAAQKPAV